MKPKISILMPCYNSVKFVEEAIKSIIQQTFTDFELIILDDGSTDGSDEVIKKIKDKRIIYHRSEKNQGLANNLNIGLKMAKGEYIARMDSDDVSLPDRLQLQVDFLNNHPDIALCSCAVQMFGADTQVWERDTDPEQVKITMLFYSPVLHPTSVWRKSVFEQYNLYYRQEAFPAEDYDLWARAVLHCKLVNISDVLYKYRIHNEQVTQTDNRAAARTSQIRATYIETVLPSLDKAYIERFIALQGINPLNTSKTKLKELKKLIKLIVAANKQDKFFQHSLLKKRLNKYYQSIVYEFVSRQKSKLGHISLILDLRFKRMMKLMMFSSILSQEKNKQ